MHRTVINALQLSVVTIGGISATRSDLRSWFLANGASVGCVVLSHDDSFVVFNSSNKVCYYILARTNFVALIIRLDDLSRSK